jgi:hypothetical protein
MRWVRGERKKRQRGERSVCGGVGGWERERGEREKERREREREEREERERRKLWVCVCERERKERRRSSTVITRLSWQLSSKAVTV